MYTHRSRGFTLIELLVVIAIIGILSSVVLASLSTARNKGNDAAIQSNLSTIQTQAEIFYGDTGNTYGTGQTGACTVTNGTMWANGPIAKAVAATEAANGAGTVVCNSSATAYAVSSTLASDTSRKWCVDSTGGSSKSTAALAATDFVCPTSN